MDGISGKAGLTPDEVLKIARQVMTEQDLADVVRIALEDAKQGGPAASQARNFIQNVMFPKDTSAVEDVRFKRVVFCSFQEFNEVEKLKARVAELEGELQSLRHGNEDD